MRVAAEHASDRLWWSGDAITAFVASDTTLALSAYRPFLDSVVVPLAVPLAVGVLALQVVVGLMLLLNARPLAALAVGGFLNLHLVAAGAVNPSIFYLLVAMVLAITTLQRRSVRQRRKVASRVTKISIAVFLLAIPMVKTIDPALVIEDPAIVLMFLAGLSVAALWLSDIQAISVQTLPAEQSDPLVPAGYKHTVTAAGERVAG